MKTPPVPLARLLAWSLLLTLILSLVDASARRSLAQLPPYQDNTRPLHTASAQADFAEVRRLLRKGADINERDRRGDTPLLLILNTPLTTPQQLKMVRLLLANGANPRLTNASRRTTLMAVVGFKGNAPMLELAAVNLLLAKAVNVNARMEGGWTALHDAACGQNEATVRRLLGAGASLEARTRSGRSTPLLLACARGGSGAVVSALLNAGADTNAVNSLNYNALELAAGNGNRPVVEVLLHHGLHIEQRGPDGETPLMLAAGCNDLKTARFLLQRGASSSDKDKKGNTPLLWAVYPMFIKDADATGAGDPSLPSEMDYRKMARLLLDNGADIHSRNKEGKTALGLAKEEENPRLITFLQQAGGEE